MQRIVEDMQSPSIATNNVTNKRIYTRFHRKPQIYPTSFQTNKTYREENLEQENMNNIITNIYKEKKYRGVLDPAAPNNKNIFIDTDSEHQKSDKETENFQRNQYKKSTKLLIAKTESQFPETYNSSNIFKRDGLVRGYYVKVNENNNNYNTFNTLTKNNRTVRTIMQTPSPDQEENVFYDEADEARTQIRASKYNTNNYIRQNYDKNAQSKRIFKKEIDLDEWPSVEKNKKLYFRNKDIQIGGKIMKSDNSNSTENQNQLNQYQKLSKKYPADMVYRRGQMKPSFSKSNISDVSEDFMNQYRKQQINENNNYIIAGNASELASPKDYKNNNIDVEKTSEEESERRAEINAYNDEDYQNYMNKRIINAPNQEIIITGRNINNSLGLDQGGKIDLNYGMKNTDIGVRNKKIIIRKNIYITIEDEIKQDPDKLNSLINLQKFIRSYLYLRELCAMKIQAIWRGRNTRKIMDLYNDLDEFIYHLSKVQFNHFNNDFCFFINQLFNIYKASISNGIYDDDTDNNNLNNEDEENENDNENCMNQLTLEEMEQKENQEYLYKFPEGSCFDQTKLVPENEVYLCVEGSSSKEYDKLVKDYEELYLQYNELKQHQKYNTNSISNTNNAHTTKKKEKNESESTIGSIKSDKFKFGPNNKAFSEIKNSGDQGKNITFSNDDYDADLDINRDDDFFNQDMSYDDKDNSGSLKEKRYSYFSIHSDENSKYFDNENPKEREKENKEGENIRNNTSKNSGGSKFNNSAKYTGCSSHYGPTKIVGLHKNNKINKNEYSYSPSDEKSKNYMGHHSKTYPRKYNYNDSINNNLIIIKHEEDFGIINNFYLSPKEREEKNHKKNALSDIAITPILPNNNKIEEKNWNEIIKYIKNEEIEIPTQKTTEENKSKKDKETKNIGTEITNELYSYENEPISNEQFHLEQTHKEVEPLVLEKKVANANIIKNKEYIAEKKFDILEPDFNNDIIIDNEDFKKKKMEQIYVEHENELNIEKDKKFMSEKKALLKTIEDKDYEIYLLKQQLEEMKEKLNRPKAFDTPLEINNNLNTLNINGIQTSRPQIQFQEMLINKITNPDPSLSNQIISQSEPKKERNWTNLSVDKVNNIELNENDNVKLTLSDTINKPDTLNKEKEEKDIRLNTLDSIIRSDNNLNINSLLEDKLKKEKEWNNLVINKTKNIKLKSKPKPKEKENIKEEVEIKRVFGGLDIEKYGLFIEREEKSEKISKPNLEIELVIKGKDEKEVEKDRTDEEKQKEDEPISESNKEKINKNNEIISENELNIIAIKKSKPILEKESQENNRFTVEKTNIKEKDPNKIQNIDNCIQFNIEKVEKKELPLEKTNNEEINILSQPREIISLISKNNEFTIDKTAPETNEQDTDTSDLIPKEIKITMKKTVKKTNVLRKEFKNNQIVNENKFDINRSEKVQLVLEQEVIENNRFTIEKVDDKNSIMVRRINPEDLQIDQSIEYIIPVDEEKVKEKISNIISDNKKENLKALEVTKNDELSLIPTVFKREIKIVTRKTLKKTNHIYSKFRDSKVVISSQDPLEIKGTEKPETQITPEITSEKVEEHAVQVEIAPIAKEQNISSVNEINILLESKLRTKKEWNNLEINKAKDLELIKIQKEKENIKEELDSNKYIIKKKEFDSLDIESMGVFIDGSGKSQKIINQNLETELVIKAANERETELPSQQEHELRHSRRMDISNEPISEEKKLRYTTEIQPQEQTNISYSYQKISHEPASEISATDKSNNILRQRKELPSDSLMEKIVIKENIKTDEEIKPASEKVFQEAMFSLEKTNIDNCIQFNIDRKYDIEDKKEEKSPREIISLISKNDEFTINKTAPETNEQDTDTSDLIPKEIKITMKKTVKKTGVLRKIFKNNQVISENQINIDGIKEPIPQQISTQDNLIEDGQKNKAQNEIEKISEMRIESIDNLPSAKNKVMNNWIDSSSKEKAEDLNIERQPPKREIKITMKKTTKKTNNIYKKFNNLSIVSDQINIEGGKEAKLPILEDTIKKEELVQLQKENDELKNELENLHKGYDELKQKRNNDNYSLDNYQLIEEKVQKVPSDLTGEEKEQKKIEETDNTFDLEKRESKNTNNEILKKTNVLIHQFKNNEICPDIQLNISSIKKKSEENNLGNNVVDKVVDVQLLHAKMQKSPNDITEKSFGDSQLLDDKLQKSNEITGKNKNVSEMGSYQNDKNKSETDKSASYEIKTGDADKERSMENQHIYTGRNTLNDISNIEKINEDSNMNTFTNFDTINVDDKINTIEPISSINITDENDIQKMKLKLNNEIGLSIDMDNDEEPESPRPEPVPQVPKKKEIIINKKLCVISKKNKKMKIEMSKQKLCDQRLLIRYWKAWKQKTEKSETKSIEAKGTKKPFVIKINKVSVKKKPVDTPKFFGKQDIEAQIKMANLRNKLMRQNKSLMLSHFFSKWKEETELEDNRILVTDSIRDIMRIYIVKYLIMYAKVLKFKSLMIKYSLSHNKNKNK